MALDSGQLGALNSLVADGVLTQAQADAVRTALSPHHSEGESNPFGKLLAEIAGYLGGGLLLAGVTLLVGNSWEHLSRPTRIAITLGITAVLIGAGVALQRSFTSARPLRVASVVLSLGAVAAAISAGVIAENHEPIWACVTGLVVATIVYGAIRGPAPLVTSGGFSVAALTAALDLAVPIPTGLYSGYFVALGLVWLVATLARVVVEEWIGIVMGVAIMIGGAQVSVGELNGAHWGYGLTALAAIVFFAAYALRSNWVLLAGGVVAATLAITEAIWDVTGGAVGGAAIVTIAGAVFLAGSGVGFWTHRARTE